MKSTHLPTAGQPHRAQGADLDATPQARSKDVLEEHRQLVARLAELEQWVQRSPASEAWAGELERKLNALVHELRAHFGGEAEGQLFAEFSAEFPHLAGTLSRLTAEHPRIVEAFLTAARNAETLASGDEARARALSAQVSAAIATLRRHEAEENEIIMSAYLDDLGGQG